MWMLQLQRVGVSRLRPRREGEGERGRDMSGVGVWGHTPLRHTYAPARSSRTAQCWCGPTQGGERRRGRERNLPRVKDEPGSSVPRFALHVGAIDTHNTAPFSPSTTS